MDIVKLLQDLTASIAALQAQLVDAQAAADSIAKENYDKGFEDGVASVPPPVSDKIYSQAELDAAVAGAVGPLQEQIASLQEQVSAMQGQIDQKVADAVALVKADLLAKYKDLEVALQVAETGFEDLLK